jgi:hypothetical protein
MTAPLPDWAELVAGFVETFGPGVRVNNLRLNTVPGWQLGESIAEMAARRGLDLVTFESFLESPAESCYLQLPTGWTHHGDAPRGTSQADLL